jgi:hypothetical protein
MHANSGHIETSAARLRGAGSTEQKCLQINEDCVNSRVVLIRPLRPSRSRARASKDGLEFVLLHLVGVAIEACEKTPEGLLAQVAAA